MNLIGLVGSAINDSHIKIIHASGLTLSTCASLTELNEIILESYQYDCILLNWDQLDGNLLEALSNFRALGIETPILVLTGSVDTNKTVQALDSGADDIAPVPIDTVELIARVKALHRRRTMTRNRNIKVGTIEYDSSSFSAFQNGKLLEFSAQESHVLGILVEHSCRPIAKLELQKIMNGYGYKVSFNALEVAIHRLRNKLKMLDLQIETIRGFGYRLDDTSRQAHF